jgi:hypothetical protein
MKLFVICRNYREKVYLTFNNPVFERRDISPSLTVTCPRCNSQEFFSNRDVYAEPDASDATSGAIIGGLIGLLAGPEGAIIGAGIGGMIGAGARERDQNAVRRFNQS